MEHKPGEWSNGKMLTRLWWGPVVLLAWEHASQSYMLPASILHPGQKRERKWASPSVYLIPIKTSLLSRNLMGWTWSLRVNVWERKKYYCGRFCLLAIQCSWENDLSAWKISFYTWGFMAGVRVGASWRTDLLLTVRQILLKIFIWPRWSKT